MTAYAIIGGGKVGSALRRSIGGRLYHVKTAAKIRRGATTFLCIPEAAIEEHAAALSALPLRYVTVSGSLTRERFAALGFKGVRTFHPLMGFTDATTFRGVPVGVDGPSLAPLARKIGALPFRIPRDRTSYHAAAVIGGAGVLAAWSLALRLIIAAGVPKRVAPDVLRPIALAALQHQTLTGPVARGDEATIAKHRAAIPKDALALYDALIAEMRRL